MCLAVPALIVELDNQIATVEIGGLKRQASTLLLPDAALGDYVLIHAGFAISLVDEAEARETLSLFDEITAAETALEDAESAAGMEMQHFDRMKESDDDNRAGLS